MKIVPLIIALTTLTISNSFAQSDEQINKRTISPITVSAYDYPSEKQDLPKSLHSINEKNIKLNVFLDKYDILGKPLLVKENKEFYVLTFGENFKKNPIKDTKYEIKGYIIPQSKETVNILFKVVTTTGVEKSVKCKNINSCTVTTPIKTKQEIKISNVPLNNENIVNINLTPSSYGLNVELKQD